MHGTTKKYVAKILREGLRPGGAKGIQHRAHVHLVERIEADGEVAGVRGGSDCIVKVNMHAFLRYRQPGPKILEKKQKRNYYDRNGFANVLLGVLGRCVCSFV